MFTTEDHGSIVLVRPLTSDVSEWLTENVGPSELPQSLWQTRANKAKALQRCERHRSAAPKRYG